VFDSFLTFLLAIVALVLAIRARNKSAVLEKRIAALEVRQAPAAPAPQPTQTETKEEPAEPTEAPRPTPVEPKPSSVEAQVYASGSAPARDFEKQFGTRWTVWVGGIALALGGIFLVRYSIEQGLLGPGTRVLLGGLLAAILIVAGEWTRRRENLSGMAGLPSAHIPGVLTAAGTTVAYATAYAAYALYDFLNPAIAFVLLGMIAIATLVAALLHGPALAALGLIGAYVAPALVATDTPSFLALYIYIVVVTGAAFLLARARLWRWLALMAIVFGMLWLLVGVADPRAVSIAPHTFFAVAGFLLAATLLVSGFMFGPNADAGEIDPVSSGAIAAYALAAALLVVAREQDLTALFAFSGLVAATIAVAWKAESAAAAVPAVAVLCVLVMTDWVVDTGIERQLAPAGRVAGAARDPATVEYSLQLGLGFVFAGLLGISGFLAQGRSSKPLVPMLWAISAVFAPVAILVALYFRITAFDRSVPFAALALALAALYGVATELLMKRRGEPGIPSASAIFAVGAVASLALALTMALEKGWLTVALALMVPGIAYIAERRPLPLLRTLAGAVATLVMLRIAAEPRIVGNDVGVTPIFNWLLWGYGVPALSFWLAAYLLRRRADDLAARIVDAGAIVLTVLLIGLQIRHYMNDGNIYRSSASLGELALQVCAGLAMTIGLERIRLRTRSVVHDYGALIVAAGTLVLIVGLLGPQNPVVTRYPVGGSFINLILLGYGIPAVLAIALALAARSTRPMPYRSVAAGVAVVLALAYLTLEVRRLFHGPIMGPLGAITDAEQYTYSAVWLVFGVVLLLVGIFLRSKPARLASAAVVTLTIAKVFLVDMAGLQGVYRALSFIGLGLVLVGIGWLYQRLLFPGGEDREPSDGPPQPPSSRPGWSWMGGR
jgi:uncharacterized membrane protein